jgi:hypothetical protein
VLLKDLEEFLFDENNHFNSYIKSKEIKIPSLRDMYRVFLENHIQEIFPNLEIALRMFLSTAETNCSADRSFSLLKRLKTIYGHVCQKIESKVLQSST